MDKGVIQIFAFDFGKVSHQIASLTIKLGYQPELIDVSQANEKNTNLFAQPRLIVFEDPVVNDDVERLRLDLGVCNVALGYPTLLVDCPDACFCAADFCAIPCNEEELALRIARSQLMLEQNSVPPPDERALAINMFGNSIIFRQALAKIRRFAAINAPTLITGETGTGKELAARAMHYTGPRKNGPFQALNCGALPDHLIENELFGHVRGAYTDARGGQKGVVELAHGGTLFLDEVDELSPKAQTALLRFLQDGTFRELGSGVEKKVDVRVISATNQNLDDLAERRLFRKDLIYRLNMLCLELPNLRSRPEDTLILAEYFLHQCELAHDLGGKVFHPATLAKMQQYSWPGNVRELENYVQRIYLTTEPPIIMEGPLDKAMVVPCGGFSTDSAVSHQMLDTADYSDELSDTCAFNFSKAKRLAVERFESEYVLRLLKHTEGNVSQAARLAGKERRCFGRLVKKYRLERTDYLE